MKKNRQQSESTGQKYSFIEVILSYLFFRAHPSKIQLIFPFEPSEDGQIFRQIEPDECSVDLDLGTRSPQTDRAQ